MIYAYKTQDIASCKTLLWYEMGFVNTQKHMFQLMGMKIIMIFQSIVCLS